MRTLLFVCLAASILVILFGCKEGRVATVKRDACNLISKAEVESVQATTVNETKSSEHSDDLFRVSQCFYTTVEFSKSVNLALVQKNPDHQNNRSPRDFWKEKFGPYNSKSRDSSTSLGMAEENEKGPAPKKISSLGDDAYWVSNRLGAAGQPCWRGTYRSESGRDPPLTIRNPADP